MRIIAIALCFALAAQDDVDAKKKKLAEVMKEAAALAERIEADPKLRQDAKVRADMERLRDDLIRRVDELTGGDDKKIDAVIEEVVKKYCPECEEQILLKPRRSSNERNTSASLKTLTTAQADFRSNDRDQNQVNDFWVKDVSALYRMAPSGKADSKIQLIEPSTAGADARPCVALDKEETFKVTPAEESRLMVAIEKPGPKAGYRFVAIESYVGPDGKPAKYDAAGTGRHPGKFAFCAYPAEYGKSGTLSFIVNEDNTLWKKDTGGKPPEWFPADPLKDGWKKLD